MDKPKYIEYNGLKFCRDDRTGYYLNSTIRKRLHRYVWECEVGPIPKGYHVHHIDGDKTNNDLSNLSIMTNTGHQRLHGQELKRKEKSRENIKKATAAAPAWHRSEAGKRWHSEHMQGFKQPRTKKVCDQCGQHYEGTAGQRFCSNACKSAWRRAQGLNSAERVCEICGKRFITPDRYRPSRFCSVECEGKNRTLINIDKRARGVPLRGKNKKSKSGG